MSSFFGVAGSEVDFEELDSHGAMHHVAWQDESPQQFHAEWVSKSCPIHHYTKLPHDDVAELCGGKRRTVNLLVRRGFRPGPNFDLVAGYNLR
eukprot:6573303-Karenia_brevis.AAC.1